MVALLRTHSVTRAAETIPWLFIAWIPFVLAYPDIAGDCNGPGGPHLPNNALGQNLDYMVNDCTHILLQKSSYPTKF
jgi:hypothetical protein